MKRLFVLVLVLAAGAARAQDVRPFRITAVDAATGRGVPLVELETVHHVRFVTDSAGVAAIDLPGLMGHRVYFHVRSDGYELPADGFGYRGVRPVLEPGGSLTVRLTRINVAERLYRVTGAGIYRDSVLLGDEVPIDEPLLSAGVLGLDSVLAAVYRGRIHWFYGDTNRASYPLGNFHATGATSRLPADGGLDPAVGIDLEYLVGEDGFVRKMCPDDEPGPVWLFGLVVVETDDGPVMAARYARMKSLGEKLEHGMAVFDDERGSFRQEVEWPLDNELGAHGHAFRVETEGRSWFYFASPYPEVRVPARLADVLDPTRYEAFTAEPDEAGRTAWAWRAGRTPIAADDRRRVPSRHRWHALTDVETGKSIRGHSGSIRWNPHRRRWVMVFQEAGGRSNLGEVWYAEGDTPIGPWRWARRIATHEQTSFYNVVHHDFLDADGGRLLHFQGTYSILFSGRKVATPRYDYNQILYRLDTDDERLHLPVPVYRIGDRLATLEGATAGERAAARVPFAARPGDRPGPDGVAVYLDGTRPTLDRPSPDARPAFHALGPEAGGRHRIDLAGALGVEAGSVPDVKVWKVDHPVPIHDPEARPIK